MSGKKFPTISPRKTTPKTYPRLKLPSNGARINKKIALEVLQDTTSSDEDKAMCKKYILNLEKNVHAQNVLKEESKYSGTEVLDAYAVLNEYVLLVPELFPSSPDQNNDDESHLLSADDQSSFNNQSLEISPITSPMKTPAKGTAQFPPLLREDSEVGSEDDTDALLSKVNALNSAQTATAVASQPPTTTTGAAAQSKKDQDYGPQLEQIIDLLDRQGQQQKATPEEQPSTTSTGASAGVEQTPLDANEAESLIMDPYAHFEVSTEHSRLFKDKERGNLGAGTVGTGAVVDLWGCVPTMPRDDILPDGLNATLSVDPDGMVTQSEGKQKDETDVYTQSILPFAKLGGEMVWLPRHGDAARFFFSSEDYDALISHIEESDGKLQLKFEDQADVAEMRSRLQRVHESIRYFCELGPLLPTTASPQQVYAEWLEMKQLSHALVKYNRQTTGMYMTEAMGMSGGIRKAVADAVSNFFPDKIPSVKAVGAAAYSKRKSSHMDDESDITLPEFNPQLTMEPVDFKRQKFSIPFL
jgi:hypothetical protein